MFKGVIEMNEISGDATLCFDQAGQHFQGVIHAYDNAQYAVYGKKSNKKYARKRNKATGLEGLDRGGRSCDCNSNSDDGASGDASEGSSGYSNGDSSINSSGDANRYLSGGSSGYSSGDANGGSSINSSGDANGYLSGGSSGYSSGDANGGSSINSSGDANGGQSINSSGDANGYLSGGSSGYSSVGASEYSSGGANGCSSSRALVTYDMKIVDCEVGDEYNLNRVHGQNGENVTIQCGSVAFRTEQTFRGQRAHMESQRTIGRKMEGTGGVVYKGPITMMVKSNSVQANKPWVL